MRVTIGERLGLVAKAPKVSQQKPTTDETGPAWDDTGPDLPVIRLADCPSSGHVPVRHEVILDYDVPQGPPRIRGEMVWLHKTAPILVIEGGALSPEDHSTGRRR